MKCAIHNEVDAAGFCRNCGKALCPQCTREVQGALYCEGCLAAMMAPPRRAGGGSSPGVALALGFIPGLGAVYNSEYVKALIQVIIFGGLIAVLSTDISEALQAMFGIGLAAFYFYMPIEAFRTAKAKQLGQLAPGPFGEGESNRPVGAIVLIVLGVLFLLGNFGYLNAEWLRRGWPVALIVLGAYLIWKRTQGQ